MALEGKKFVELNDVTEIAKETEKAFVKKEEGKALSSNDYTSADKAKVDGAVQDSELSEKVNPLLSDYMKTSDADDKYLQSSVADTTYAKASKVTELEGTLTELGEKAQDMWKLADDPVKTKEDLATLKDTAVKGQGYIISDDSNHVYIFLGEGTQGCDENGFYDTQTHISLEGYIKESDIQVATAQDIQEAYQQGLTQ